MIQSASAQRAKSSSKLPMATLSASEGTKNAAGRDLRADSSPARTMRLRSLAGAPGGRSGGTMSSRTHGRPALAKCAAIRAPIVPAPRTTAFSMRRFMQEFSSAGQGTKPVSSGQTKHRAAAPGRDRLLSGGRYAATGKHDWTQSGHGAGMAEKRRGEAAHAGAERRR